MILLGMWIVGRTSNSLTPCVIFQIMESIGLVFSRWSLWKWIINTVATTILSIAGMSAVRARILHWITFSFDFRSNSGLHLGF